MLILKPTRGTFLNKTHHLARGLVGCWLMNSGTGNTIFDLSRNSNNGTFASGVNAPSWDSGKYGSDIYFSNGSRYIDVGAVTPWVGATWTICVWVKFTDVTKDNFFASGSISGSSNEVFRLYTSSSAIAALGDNGASKISISGSTLSNDTWYMISLVCDVPGSLATLYLNESSDGTDSTIQDAGDTLGAFRIGCPNWTATSGLYGYISHIYLFKKALSVSEIALLFREPFCMFERDISPAYFYVAAGPGGLSIPVAMNQLRSQKVA